MKILVTGATGFIGKNLIEELKKENEIHLLIRTITLEIQNLKLDYFVFNTDIAALHSYISDNEIEGIVHLASLFLSSHKDTDIENLIQSNIFLGTALLQASLNTKVRWFLNTGTFWQNYTTDSKEYNPVNLYAATKQAFIDLAKYYVETSDIKFLTLKICDTFGQGDPRPKVFNLWLKHAISGEILEMSEGKQLIEILYIDDIISGFLKAMELLNRKDTIAQEYALYALRRYTLRELADIFSQAINKPLNIVWGKRSYREREVMIPWNMGEKLPNWEAEISIEEGIQKLFDLN